MTSTATEYAFSNSSAEAQAQLAALETLLDPTTISVLDQLQLPSGARCLEIGAGGGSIARRLADKVGPTGTVLAIDKDTSRLHIDADNITVAKHDIRHGLPDAGPYNLIHARLVLLHLPERLTILRTLADALAVGGWLVLGEFSDQTLSVRCVPSLEDAALFGTVTSALLRILGDHGADMTWAYQVPVAMRDAGLHVLHGAEHADIWRGGGTGCQLHKTNTVQKQDELAAAGVSVDDLTRFRQLMDDPTFAARGYQLVCTAAQRTA